MNRLHRAIAASTIAVVAMVGLTACDPASSRDCRSDKTSAMGFARPFVRPPIIVRPAPPRPAAPAPAKPAQPSAPKPASPVVPAPTSPLPWFLPFWVTSGRGC